MRRIAVVVAAAVALGCPKTPEVKQGPAGATGAPGATGATGATGPRGPSGTRAVFFNNDSFAGNVAGFSPRCQVGPYVAGPGEAAVIRPAISCSSVPVGGQIGVRSAFNENGAGDVDIPWTLVSTNGGAVATYMATANNAVLGLNAGSSYVFEAYLYLSSQPAGTCYCDLVVEIVVPQ